MRSSVCDFVDGHESPRRPSGPSAAQPRDRKSTRGAEGYDDPDQVIVSTGSVGAGNITTANPAFRALGGSVGVDITPYARVAWRSEIRGWRNRGALFPDGNKSTPSRNNVFAVTSLSLTF